MYTVSSQKAKLLFLLYIIFCFNIYLLLACWSAAALTFYVKIYWLTDWLNTPLFCTLGDERIQSTQIVPVANLKHEGCALGLETVSRRTNVSSHLGLVSAICVACPDAILPKLVRIKGTEYCTDFLSLSKQGVYAWSRLHVIAPYNLILCIIIVIINGRETKAIIITSRPRPILTSRWRLVTHKRLVSVSYRSRALTSRTHPCL